MTTQSLTLNTFCLLEQQFVGVYHQFKNTLAESIYGNEMLQGIEPIGDNTATPLFIVDCSLLIADIDAAFENGEVQQYMLEAKLKVEPGTKLSDYKQDCTNNVIKSRLDALSSINSRVVFATGSRKDGKLFAFAGEWVDYLGSKAISHGNNLMSDNMGLSVNKDLKVLIVDDDDKELMKWYGLGDCHGIVKSDLCHQLGSPLTRNPFQYRGFFHEPKIIFKGVLRPVNGGQLHHGRMEHVDMVIPASSMKYDKALTNLDADCYELNTTLIVHKCAKGRNSSFGLNAQYFKSKSSVDQLRAIAQANLEKLNQFINKGGELDTYAIANLMIEDPVDKDAVDHLNLYQAVAKIVKVDRLGILAGHPLILRIVSEWFTNQVKKIATTAGIRQRFLLACPLNELEGIPNAIILNDKRFSDNKGLVSRFPLRNRNDIQCTQVINLFDVWAIHDAQLKVEIMLTPEQKKEAFLLILSEYLAGFDLTTDQCELIFNTIIEQQLHYFNDCFFIAPSFWATYGGDFDGDYGSILGYSEAPELYKECLSWDRLPEAEKPEKIPMDGSINDQAVASFGNDIGILSWMATIMNTTMGDADYIKVAPAIAQQMQIAVDAYKTKTKVDEKLKADWAQYCRGAIWRKTHWIKYYKSTELYKTHKNTLPETPDTIGQIASVANQYFKEINITPQKLDSYRDLLTVSHEHYHYHKPEWGFKTKPNGEFVLDQKNEKIPVTLHDKVADFYIGYCQSVDEFARYYEDGDLVNSYTNELGELVRLSDADKRRIRDKKRSALLSYERQWNEWLNTCPTDQLRNILKAVLWNVGHSKAARGSAALVLYLLRREVLESLVSNRKVSMKLVTTAPELLEPGSIPAGRSLKIVIKNERTKKFNNPRALYLCDEFKAGEIYPAPAKTFGRGAQKQVAMRFDRLVVTGEFPANFRYLRTSNGKAEYEVVVALVQDEGLDESFTVTNKQLELADVC